MNDLTEHLESSIYRGSIVILRSLASYLAEIAAKRGKGISVETALLCNPFPFHLIPAEKSSLSFPPLRSYCPRQPPLAHRRTKREHRVRQPK